MDFKYQQIDETNDVWEIDIFGEKFEVTGRENIGEFISKEIVDPLSDMADMVTSGKFIRANSNFVECAQKPGLPFRTINYGNNSNLDPDLPWRHK